MTLPLWLGLLSLLTMTLGMVAFLRHDTTRRECQRNAEIYRAIVAAGQDQTHLDPP